MKYLKTYENFYTDDEIEEIFKNFEVTFFKIDNIHLDDGGASGGIQISFEQDGDETTKYDNWIRYDSNPDNIAFDHWYPTQIANKLKEYINRGIEDWKMKKDAEQYNL